MIPDSLQAISLIEELILEDVAAAGDGGSIFLWMSDNKSIKLTVTLYQTEIPENYVDIQNPTFFLVNDVPIPVRSEIEKHVLSELREFRFGNEFFIQDQIVIRAIINKRIDFIESDAYLIKASKTNL